MKTYSVIFSLGLLLVSLIGGPAWSAAAGPKELAENAITETLDSFLRASYARDAGSAYQYLSQTDRAVKSSQEYVAENGHYSGFALELTRRLAATIQMNDMVVSINGERATVTFDAILPDANHPSLAGIVEGFNVDRLQALDAATKTARLDELNRLANSNQLAVLSSADEQWELIREGGQWRVFVNWADAIEVTFSSVVSQSLEWEFYPTRELVLAQPGQTIQMSYIAVNKGKNASTGKARHTIGSADNANYLEIVACFCFLEQVLEPGEEVELPLVFRIDYEVPEGVSAFTVRYHFYPESEFPTDEGQV